MQLLHIDSSILGENSASRRLTAEVVEAERRRVPGLAVVYRDLAAEPLGHISGGHLGAAQGADLELPEGLRRDVALGQEALEEFLASDVVVIGAPMYNFTIPSQLKAWIDRITVAGKTFRYGPNGVEGLAGGKRVIVVSTRGGLYGATTPMAAFDHQEPYLEALLRFLGITDVAVVRAEGLKMGDHAAASMEAALSAAAALA
ncbi:FMN-dependent NADH-azoreductase [Paludisphaera rhizosphaerae]|uniref:FMN-dependent NADH-azoreductase n=1 Tax=Paludisphaera rhizosphaerae TaxID=2711216 RepID=UPI0013EB7DA0|nr:NAD(P)H-dependent oxidoreductase [Paludisphaera rhizosphaerae]